MQYNITLNACNDITVLLASRLPQLGRCDSFGQGDIKKALVYLAAPVCLTPSIHWCPECLDLTAVGAGKRDGKERAKDGKLGASWHQTR